MGYTFGGSTVVKRFDVSALVDHMELLVCNIHICHHVLPFVLFANEEFVLGGEGDAATFANETKESHVAL